jgi:hypothetical protein
MLLFLVIVVMIFLLGVQWFQAMMIFLLMLLGGLIVPSCDVLFYHAFK